MGEERDAARVRCRDCGRRASQGRLQGAQQRPPPLARRDRAAGAPRLRWCGSSRRSRRSEAALVSAIDPRGTRLANCGVESGGRSPLSSCARRGERQSSRSSLRDRRSQVVVPRALRARERFQQSSRRPKQVCARQKSAAAQRLAPRTLGFEFRAHVAEPKPARRPGEWRETHWAPTECAGARPSGRAVRAEVGLATDARASSSRADRRAGQEPTSGLRPRAASRASRCSRGSGGVFADRGDTRTALPESAYVLGRPAAREDARAVSPGAGFRAGRRRRNRSSRAARVVLRLRCSPVWKSRLRARRSLRCS